MIVGLVLTTSAGAVAVDLARAYSLREKLRITADAAALAAGTRLPDEAAARAAALAYSEKNMPAADYGTVLRPEDIEFGSWQPGSGSLVESDGPPSAVRVTMRLSAANGNAADMVFAGMLGFAALDLNARATAGRQSPSCVIALDPDSAKSMRLHKQAALSAENCNVQINSAHANALELKDSARLLAGGVCVAGGAKIDADASTEPEPTLSCPPAPDPLAGLPAPEIGGCDQNNARYKDADAQLTPGVFCGGLQIGGSSKVELAAGLYVIKDGSLSVRDEAQLIGEGVTIYLTGSGAVFNLDAAAELTLSAPKDGELAGVLMFQDPDSSGTSQWHGSAPVALVGTIYLPNGNLTAEGNSTITPLNSCSVLIARTIRFAKSSGMSLDLSSAACRSALPSALRGAVTLLE